MKTLLISFIFSLLFISCRKESNASISFVLLGETQPFIADSSIVSYERSDFLFTLTPTAAQKVRDNIKKDYVLKVDNDTIYEGTFWIDYLSSLPNKLVAASIAPTAGEMRMWLFNHKASDPDPRNDTRLIRALRSADKLK
ncbi:MAG: hypothetical protein JNL70_03070 [Saprospiraceae bacterium]|nr:hypothetical protein [Saprospiraceae bacterium]